MGIPDRALELEIRSLGSNGEPTLGEAYEVLRACWRSGDRGRELGLHLMFLAWYMLCEPSQYTGLNVKRTPLSELVDRFNEVHDYFAFVVSGDAEMLYAIGLMAYLFPFLLGDERLWEARSREYRAKYRKLAPAGIDPAVFEGRGAYGEYFRHQAKGANAY